MMFGQISSKDYKVSTSSAYDVVDGSKYYFSSDSEVKMVKFTRKEIILQKYDAVKKRLVKRRELPKLEKGANIEAVLEIQDNYYIFYSLWDKKNTLEQLYYTKINWDKYTLSKAERIIKVNGKLTGAGLTTSFGAFGFGISFGTKDKFNFSDSFDDSRLVIQYRKKPNTKNDKKSYDEIGMFVFDPSLNEIWGDEFKMPFTEAQMNNIDFDIDSKGNAYILTEVYDSDVSKKYIKKQKNYHLEMLKITDGEVEKIKIKENKDFHINNIWMHEGSDNNMYLTGYYNEEKGYYKNVDGVFLMTMDQDGSITSSSHHKIPLEVINQYKSKRTQKRNESKDKKGNLDFENLVLREMILNKDGTVLLIGEQYYVRVYTDSKGRRRYTYYYEDILVTKLDDAGDLVYMRKLPKRQKGAAPKGQMGYQHTNHKGNDYFFYIDNDKNIDLAVDEKPKYHVSGLGGILTAYKIDSDGEVSKNSVADLKKIPVRGGKPMAIYQFSVNRIFGTEKGLLFEAYKKGKEDVMIHVDFKD